mgnify:CR=1 FL=1
MFLIAVRGDGIGEGAEEAAAGGRGVLFYLKCLETTGESIDIKQSIKNAPMASPASIDKGSPEDEERSAERYIMREFVRELASAVSPAKRMIVLRVIPVMS